MTVFKPMVVPLVQENGEICTGQVILQPISLKSDRLLDMEAVKNSIRDVTKLRGEVALVASGALANDGKVIEDCRSYM